MQRFFIIRFPLWKDIIISNPSFVHQISRVLRSEIGDRIILFNGDGQEYAYIIRSIKKQEVSLSFLSSYGNLADPRKSIHLYQAIPNKYEKIEYILQKGTEVWVSEFVFFRSERSQHLVINTRKIERFQEIVREATEQCWGNKIPCITFMEGKIPVPENGSSYVLHTDAANSRHIRDIPADLSPVNIFIGPEGGWSPTEMSHFEEMGIQNVYLGERVLRTETTGSVIVFFLLQR